MPVHTLGPKHAQLTDPPQTAGMSTQWRSGAGFFTLVTQAYFDVSQSEQAATLAHSPAGTQSPAQQLPFTRGTSPAEHLGGMERHTTLLESHS